MMGTLKWDEVAQNRTVKETVMPDIITGLETCVLVSGQ